MLDFTSKIISNIKKALLKQQQEIAKNLKEVEAEDPAVEERVAESSEPGTDAYIADTHAKTVVVEEMLKKSGNSIKKALVKIGNGSYGKCESCNKQIELKRLLAMPTAVFCLSCSQKKLKNSR